MLLTEGYDEPSIDCVVCLRPTKVRALYSQIIGRGTRMYGGKDHLLVLDFLWQSEEHSLIKPAHLIAEDEEDARALTEKLGGEGDLEEAREAVNADRTRSLADRLRDNRRRKGSVLDPLELAVTLNEAHLAEFVPAMHGRAMPHRTSSSMSCEIRHRHGCGPHQRPRVVPVGPAHHAPAAGSGDAEASPRVAPLRPPPPGNRHLRGRQGIPRCPIRQCR